MSKYSPAVMLVWQIAAGETAYAKYQFIEREQLFIGLLKADDVLRPEILAQLEFNVEDLNILRDEFMLIKDIFSKLGIECSTLRRTVRTIVGQGGYENKERVVHRSEACKYLFSRALEFAKDDNSYNLKAVHLLQAILEDAGRIIEKALESLGVESKLVKEMALQLKKKERETVGPESPFRENEEIGKAGGGKKTLLIDIYGSDLTKLAYEGKIEPLIGRRQELLKVIRTLSRKKKNNPILIGEAGVGKTAIVRGLAQRIIAQNIAPSLRDKRIVELNMGTLIAGTKYRGEFEERLTGIIKEVKSNPEIILFIDEIHTLIGAGKAEGATDAANIMKPALANGEISCIGATTLGEFRKYIEKDPALERRFQPIMIEEPSEEETIQILKGLKEKYEEHHGVSILDEALESAVKLSIRHLQDRRLPDKALDIIDEACTRVKIGALSFYGKIDELESQRGRVTVEIVETVVADWSRRPVEKVSLREQEKLIKMKEEIEKRIIGQGEAIEKVEQIIKMSKAGLRDPKKPIGIFLFLGPTGVGKTELAKVLADILFGSENEMIRLDMSEFMEKHSVAKLIGAPPGYIGYDEEGQLTGRLRTHPYTVVLFDEIDKAHPEVLDIFLQLFDEGRLTDAKGRTVDARDAIFIMTSNIGSEIHEKKICGFGIEDEKTKGLEFNSQLKLRLRPEFLNRIDDVVIFRALSSDAVARIVTLMIEKLQKRMLEQGIILEFSNNAISFIADNGYNPEYGARLLERTIEQFVSKPLAEGIIKNEIRKGDKISVNVQNSKIILSSSKA